MSKSLEHRYKLIVLDRVHGSTLETILSFSAMLGSYQSDCIGFELVVLRKSTARLDEQYKKEKYCSKPCSIEDGSHSMDQFREQRHF